jgi:hypothetical protein
MLGTFELEVASEKRLAHLEKNAQSFEDHLEKILIKFNEQNLSDVTYSIRWCLSNLMNASGRQVLILKEQLEMLEQNIFLEQMGEKVITADTLGILLNEAKAAPRSPTCAGDGSTSPASAATASSTTAGGAASTTAPAACSTRRRSDAWRA